MKYLHCVIAFAAVTFIANTQQVSAADCSTSSCCMMSAAPVIIFVSKSGDSLAKVTEGSKSTHVPIKFAEGASWDNVKDSYSVSPKTASDLQTGKACMSVDADGKATFCPTKKKK